MVGRKDPAMGMAMDKTYNIPACIDVWDCTVYKYMKVSVVYSKV